jgi:hypothetical protein
MEKLPKDSTKNKNNKMIYINKSQIIRCVRCNQIPILKIFPKTNEISIKCQAHNNICDYSNFLQNCKIKCIFCFVPLSITTNNYFCEKCHKIFNLNDALNCTNDSPLYKSSYFGFCISCNKNFDNYNEHNNKYCKCNFYRGKILKPQDEDYINNILIKKEYQLKTLFNFINNISDNNKFKEKGNQILLLLEEKRKELNIEKLIFMNYQDYKYNYFFLENVRSLLEFEQTNIFNELIMPLNGPKINYGIMLNEIRSYLQNGYKGVSLVHNDFNLEHYKDYNNVYEIQKKNIKSIVALNESLIATGGWDRLLIIFNTYTNKKIYSVETPSMIFNLKKYPLIEQKDFKINNHGLLVCLYCELHILNIKEKNCEIQGIDLICQIKGLGNYIWTSIIMDDKKIISACLDHRLSAHKLLPNDRNTNNGIGYCLINSNMNKDKEVITSLLQIDANNFVSSSSMDLCDDPSIKFWRIENDNFFLEKAIYDIYCCQYANTICKINDKILGFALEYASLSGKEGGIALADINFKDIFAIVKRDNITCLKSISNNRFFACSYDKNDKKRYIKEYMMNREELEEKYKLEIHHSDDIINIELIKESDLMVISSDDGKITIFDNYSV